MNYSFLKANFKEADEIVNIFENAKKVQWDNNIFQWTKDYPSLKDVLNDISNSNLYVLKKENTILGVVTIILEKDINLNKVLKINRLSANLSLNIKGIGTILMDEVEKKANELNASYMEGTTNSKNIAMIKLFEKKSFKKINEFYLEKYIKYPFYTFNKKLKNEF